MYHTEEEETVGESPAGRRPWSDPLPTHLYIATYAVLPASSSESSVHNSNMPNDCHSYALHIRAQNYWSGYIVDAMYKKVVLHSNLPLAPALQSIRPTSQPDQSLMTSALV